MAAKRIDKIVPRDDLTNDEWDAASSWLKSLGVEPTAIAAHIEIEHGWRKHVLVVHKIRRGGSDPVRLNLGVKMPYVPWLATLQSRRLLAANRPENG